MMKKQMFQVRRAQSTRASIDPSMVKVDVIQHRNKWMMQIVNLLSYPMLAYASASTI
jgi:hypothetical protein